MANIHGVHSVGNSVVQFLDNAYPQALRELYQCDFQLVAGNQLEGDVDFGTSVTVYMYRIIVDEFLRTKVANERPSGTRPPLSVDLHFMLTVWADSAAAEQTIFTWVMQQLNDHPILDRSSLTPEGGWERGETVHIVPAELSNEDLMRIWDVLSPSYRLSTSYIARTVRINPEIEPGGQRVVATRFAYSELEPDEIPEVTDG